MSDDEWRQLLDDLIAALRKGYVSGLDPEPLRHQGLDALAKYVEEHPK